MLSVTLYVATSLDGYIADKNGGVDWLPDPSEELLEAVGHQQFMNSIDFIVMGSRSFKKTLSFGEWAWPNKRTIVFSKHSPLPSELIEGVEFFDESPSIFMRNLGESESNKKVWLFGGAELVKSFAEEGLIDECIITVVPSKIGEGIFLDLPYDHFQLIEEKDCGEGIIQKRYVSVS
ncbi:MAG: deaminase [Waddliaceae bacterium]|nr:deaminase [Waddliaceae bacterium]